MLISFTYLLLIQVVEDCSPLMGTGSSHTQYACTTYLRRSGAGFEGKLSYVKFPRK